jgi:hypothetical protein
MSWLDLRKAKTFFAAKGSKLLSVGEQKMRIKMEDAALCYQTGSVQHEGDSIDYVRCIDVQAQLTAVLNSQAAAGHLVQRSAISGTALRATVLGDKGGHFTKLVLIVWDVEQCQSPNNSIVLGMYRYGEDYDLIKEVFGPILKELSVISVYDILPSAVPSSDKLSTDVQHRKPDCHRCASLERRGVTRTQQTCNRYESLELTYGGDMQWLSTLIGTSGPSGRQFCTICTISSDRCTAGTVHALFPMDGNVVDPRAFESHPPRSLTQAMDEHKRFELAGAKHDHAKLYCNQIRPPILHTEFVGRVTPSPMHITLGLVYRAFCSLEHEIKRLDITALKLRGFSDSTAASLQTLYEKENALKQSIATATDSIAQKSDDIALARAQIDEYHQTCDLSERVYDRRERHLLNDVKRLRQSVNDHRTAIATLNKSIAQWQSELTALDETIQLQMGPFRGAFNALVKALNINRQSYHGGSLIGNDCDKVLRHWREFGMLLRAIDLKKTNGRIVRCGDDRAAQRFTTLFHKLYQCYQLYSVARPLCCHELCALELRCASLGNWFPCAFPKESLPPKFHLLTKHIPIFARRWQTVGLASEQSVESMNRIVNRLERTYTTISNREQQLTALMDQLLLENNPDVRTITTRLRMCPRCDLPIARRFATHCKCQKRTHTKTPLTASLTPLTPTFCEHYK